MKKLPEEKIDEIKAYLLSLANDDGSFRASLEEGYLGIADSKVSDLAATVYVAEIAKTIGMELPYPNKTIAYIKARQHNDGYFRSITEFPGVDQAVFYIYNTCMGLRGLKVFNESPDYNPLPFMEEKIRDLTKTFYPYAPDMLANSYASLEEEMPEDCKNILTDALLNLQDPETGWIIQPGLKERGLPYQRNNPMTFHAARAFHLIGKEIPMSSKILDTFMEFQQEDGSWELGYVHGTFDACVAVKILSDNSAIYQKAYERAAEWTLTCQQEDKGFNHFGDDKPAEIDACYFQISTLVMAGLIPTKLTSANKWIGWGHTLQR